MCWIRRRNGSLTKFVKSVSGIKCLKSRPKSELKFNNAEKAVLRNLHNLIVNRTGQINAKQFEKILECVEPPINGNFMAKLFYMADKDAKGYLDAGEWEYIIWLIFRSNMVPKDFRRVTLNKFSGAGDFEPHLMFEETECKVDFFHSINNRKIYSKNKKRKSEVKETLKKTSKWDKFRKKIGLNCIFRFISLKLSNSVSPDIQEDQQITTKDNNSHDTIKQQCDFSRNPLQFTCVKSEDFLQSSPTQYRKNEEEYNSSSNGSINYKFQQDQISDSFHESMQADNFPIMSSTPQTRSEKFNFFENELISLKLEENSKTPVEIRNQFNSGMTCGECNTSEVCESGSFHESDVFGWNSRWSCNLNKNYISCTTNSAPEIQDITEDINSAIVRPITPDSQKEVPYNENLENDHFENTDIRKLEGTETFSPLYDEYSMTKNDTASLSFLPCKVEDYKICDIEKSDASSTRSIDDNTANCSDSDSRSYGKLIVPNNEGEDSTPAHEVKVLDEKLRKSALFNIKQALIYEGNSVQKLRRFWPIVCQNERLLKSWAQAKNTEERRKLLRLTKTMIDVRSKGFSNSDRPENLDLGELRFFNKYNEMWNIYRGNRKS